MIHPNQVIARLGRRSFGAAGRGVRTAGLACALALLCAQGVVAAPAAPLPVAPVQAEALAPTRTEDGQVEALRQATVAAQVAGTVLELNVRAGDAVRAGQVLLRIDARAAEQGAAASTAQVAAAQAALDAATSELARKRQLADKKYISQGALEQAESQYRSAQAQVRAEIIKHLFAHLPAGAFDAEEINLKAGAVFAHLYTTGLQGDAQVYH